MLMLLMLLVLGDDPLITFETAYETELTSEHEILRVRSIAVSSDDVAATVDRFGKRVVMVSPNGEIAAVIDKPGQGPGELDNPEFLAWCPGDEVFVFLDYGNHRR